jgi:uncharacterized protein YndB with AHSA1/START domain
MVRHAERPAVETSVTIDAPPERVWSVITDINFPAYFSDEFQGAEWIDDGPALRARFVGRNSHPIAGEWETTCTVETFEPMSSFGYVVGNPEEPSARWRFDLAPTPEGVRLTMRAQMGPGRSGVTYFIHKHPELEEEIVANRLGEWRINMEATLNGIKTWTEGCCSTSRRSAPDAACPAPLPVTGSASGNT